MGGYWAADCTIFSKMVPCLQGHTTILYTLGICFHCLAVVERVCRCSYRPGGCCATRVPPVSQPSSCFTKPAALVVTMRCVYPRGHVDVTWARQRFRTTG